MMACLSPYAKPHDFNDGEQLALKSEQFQQVLLIRSGQFDIYRRDDLLMMTCSAAYILGVSEYLVGAGHHYVLARGRCSALSISGEEMTQRLTQQGLWHDMVHMLSWQIQLIAARDEQLSCVDAYTIVRNKIIEYSQMPDSVRDTTALVTFIRQRTFLSQSMIHQFIADLKKGGFITVSKGRLIEIKKKIPLAY